MSSSPFDTTDGGLPAARRGARAARPQAELHLPSMVMAASAGPAARNPMPGDSSGTLSSAPSVSSIHVALPPLDRAAVRASISHLTGILEHVTALAALESDHEELQGRFWALQNRVGVLEEELASAYANAAPFVAHCQHAYDILSGQWQASQLECAEMRSALAQRLDNSGKVKDVQQSIDLEKQIRADETQWLHDQIADFEAKLVSARVASKHPAVSDKALHQARGERDRALQRAAESDEAARAWEASSSALETASTQLRHQVEIQEARWSIFKISWVAAHAAFNASWIVLMRSAIAYGIGPRTPRSSCSRPPLNCTSVPNIVIVSPPVCAPIGSANRSSSTSISWDSNLLSSP
ncbi:unnamed protein product [Phytophthora fragariaefolia]|uniref:Unnamed protein product n=1 Tax=Phytophthora fragariaefolia TaxID=1490495 RepID=A0A9W6XZC8_9STRA|nr:unnamed protein product [Phytophthora fragariaefolia]